METLSGVVLIEYFYSAFPGKEKLESACMMKVPEIVYSLLIMEGIQIHLDQPVLQDLYKDAEGNFNFEEFAQNTSSLVAEQLTSGGGYHPVFIFGNKSVISVTSKALQHFSPSHYNYHTIVNGDFYTILPKLDGPGFVFQEIRSLVSKSIVLEPRYTT